VIAAHTQLTLARKTADDLSRPGESRPSRARLRREFRNLPAPALPNPYTEIINARPEVLTWIQEPSPARTP
jgi:hypothetical protein